MSELKTCRASTRLGDVQWNLTEAAARVRKLEVELQAIRQNERTLVVSLSRMQNEARKYRELSTTLRAKLGARVDSSMGAHLQAMADVVVMACSFVRHEDAYHSSEEHCEDYHRLRQAVLAYNHSRTLRDLGGSNEG